MGFHRATPISRPVGLLAQACNALLLRFQPPAIARTLSSTLAPFRSHAVPPESSFVPLSRPGPESPPCFSAAQSRRCPSDRFPQRRDRRRIRRSEERAATEQPTQALGIFFSLCITIMA